METMITDILLATFLPFLIVFAKPIVLIRERILPIEEYDEWSPGIQLLHELITCPWCIAFWVGLMTSGLTTAIIASGMAYKLDYN